LRAEKEAKLERGAKEERGAKAAKELQSLLDPDPDPCPIRRTHETSKVRPKK